MSEQLNSHAATVRSVARDLHASEPIDPDAVAETMQALAAPSRVRILSHLRAGPSSVNDLAEAVGMDASAVSHQLRVLRHLGFVVGRRDGRRVLYDLHDDDVAKLLDEAVGHVAHVRTGLSGRRTVAEGVTA